MKAAAGAVIAGGALSVAKLGWGRLGSRENPRRFRLREGESVSEGLIRIAIGQLDTAIEQLEKGSEESVHEVRKSFKRLRAIVRLARDQLGDEIYERENRDLRDLGRRLSATRDSQVLLETLDAVAGRHAPPGLRQAVAAEHARAEREGIPDDVAPELHRLRERVASWPLEQDGLESLESGFRRIYRRARRAYRRAQKDPTVENLHELRKRTKDVWYCAQILRPASRERMKRLASEAHRLSDVVGEEHDLAILSERVAEGQPLARSINRRREELVSVAMDLGRRTYRKKPRKVVRPLSQAAA
jgi:CHAD domain-containing protein